MKTIVYCLSQTNRYPFLCRFFSQELERHSRFDKYDYNNLTALAGVPLAAKYLDDLKAIIYNKCNNLNNLMDENFHSNLSRELRDKESELRDEHEQQKQSALNNSNPVINQAVNNTANVSLSQLSFLKNLSLSSLTDSNSNI
ncbi:MAG: hypothetical protein GY718_08460 [Lentisphaerae bacterium]|nr:hypothetical protein [Lentisphaerota bacterium]